MFTMKLKHLITFSLILIPIWAVPLLESNNDLTTLNTLIRTRLDQFNLTIPNYVEATSVVGVVTCILCNAVVSILYTEMKSNWSDSAIATEATTFCVLLKIEDQRVCEGLVNENVGIFTYIAANSNRSISNIAQRVCGLLLQSQNCDTGDNYNWQISNIPDGYSPEHKKPTNSSGSFKILHMSDMHYDPNYQIGKVKNCGEPLCCQDDQADGNTSDNTACGYWGEYYSADTPLHTVQEVLRQAATHDITYVYYTGDTIHHRVWATTNRQNSQDISTLFKSFRNAFGKIPVFPVIGNHEASPVNVFSAQNVSNDNLSTQWLYDLYAEEVAQWLGNSSDLMDTIKKGGYYSYSPTKGLRVIVLNNNAGNIQNWWLYNEDVDLYGQLAWLADTLTKSEKDNELVHILYHIPMGSGSVMKTWSNEYNKIVTRFANTIAAQFDGHTHKDQFVVFYNQSSTKIQPINVAWNGASINADASNPNYKIYDVDTTTFQVMDHEVWTFNLTDANIRGESRPTWYKLFNFKQAYGINSTFLDAETVDELVHSMAENHSLLKRFHNFRYRNSDVAGNCDTNCQTNYICTLAVSKYNGNTVCEYFQQLYTNGTDGTVPVLPKPNKGIMWKLSSSLLSVLVLISLMYH